MVVALELVKRLALIRLDHVRHVLVGMDVTYPHTIAIGDQRIADRVNQVGLAQTHTAIQKEWVIGDTGVLGHLQGRCACQLVGFTRHEVVESQFGVQARTILYRIHHRRHGRVGNRRGQVFHRRGCLQAQERHDRPGRDEAPRWPRAARTEPLRDIRRNPKPVPLCEWRNSCGPNPV